jgi:hypothetical protein
VSDDIRPTADDRARDLKADWEWFRQTKALLVELAGRLPAAADVALKRALAAEAEAARLRKLLWADGIDPDAPLPPGLHQKLQHAVADMAEAVRQREQAERQAEDVRAELTKAQAERDQARKERDALADLAERLADVRRTLDRFDNDFAAVDPAQWDELWAALAAARAPQKD